MESGGCGHRTPKEIMFDTEVLLVGAGPIGIELAVALKARGIDYVHLDANQIGSTIAWYAPQTHFFSSPERIAIAGVPLQTLDQAKATREEYLTYLRAVVQQFDLQIETFERVVALRRSANGFEAISVRAGSERHWRARNVVLAIGDMHRPRRIDVPGEELPHVSHYFGDPHHYFRRRVLIVGGQNSAVEAAIRCYRVGAQVTLSYRGHALDANRIKFWLLPEIRSLIRDGRLVWLPSTTVREIRPDRVVLDPEREILADAVLLAHRLRAGQRSLRTGRRCARRRGAASAVRRTDHGDERPGTVRGRHRDGGHAARRREGVHRDQSRARRAHHRGTDAHRAAAGRAGVRVAGSLMPGDVLARSAER